MEGMEKGSIKKSKYAPAGTGENAEVLRISIFPTADSALQEEGKSVPARPQIQQEDEGSSEHFKAKFAELLEQQKNAQFPGK
eukprot:CAMPEP_0174334644 /NCGR_PEP_ID=MMETSP0810-20121108/20096_1 /TAXON_ID=73025 ORGANISM="Eutreptiella gymnastica-like, Strain CCMP1594" /NCGR_SAMPLE_ID=MMETSP0810 /ASSEMBLY_ACC=CAM_ASM_000659 /LENGTH=81 /DNA_ID=CAMNT_0015452443 /DNA_START=1142 /DNA_END=1388 /DNA_ORIENTATION=-